MTRSLCVVSEEGGTAPTFPKVPQMYWKFGVAHMHILDVMRAEGWTF
jgi:hypothetical protein